MESEEMTAEFVNDTEPKDSIGQKFKEAREAQGKTVADVADHLNLGAQMVIDIENDDYSSFAGVVYAKGYLRTYAKFVSLPESDIIQEFSGSSLGNTIKTREPNYIQPKPPLIDKKYQNWIVWSLASVFIIGFVYWWSAGSAHSSDNILVLEKVKPIIAKKPVKAKAKAEPKKVEAKAPIEKPILKAEKKVEEDKNVKATTHTLFINPLDEDFKEESLSG